MQLRQLRMGDRFLRGKQVRLISQNNEQVGIVSFEEALRRAQQVGLDLVEMPSKAEFPVCRIMDYGKYMFDESKRQREAKKAQVQSKVKEIKLHATIDENDFQVKYRKVVEFLQKGDKVRVLLTYRGREMAHPEIGEQVMNRMLKSVEEMSNLDSPPKKMGKNITAVLSVKPQYRVAKGASAKNNDASASEDDDK